MTTRVLYVDDEPDLREIAVMALELDDEFEVRSCASGSEALAVAGEWRPDLILLDVMMPGLSGPETKRKLSSDAGTAAIPVVFITAAARGREREDLMKLGALSVIAKPFDPMTLATTVRGLIEAA